MTGVISFTGLSDIPCPSDAATTAWLVETFLRVCPLNRGSVAAGRVWLSKAMLVACPQLAQFGWCRCLGPRVQELEKDPP